MKEIRNIPNTIVKKLQERRESDAFRELSAERFEVDFWSNDYLGFSASEKIAFQVDEIVKTYPLRNGATGSRLISGNFELYTRVEQVVAQHHNSEGCLLFNSGYDANVGIFSSIPQKGDVVLYDQYIHASIRDGIGLGLAKAFKFKHNDCEDLERWLQKMQPQYEHIFVVTESVFSMDGDSPDFYRMTDLCERYGAYLIVDEAHAVGVWGEKGQGLLSHLGLEEKAFLRLVTFSKGLGAHGAGVLAPKIVLDYLVNFARSFIYTTGLSPHSVATILAAYHELSHTENIQQLHHIIYIFKEKLHNYGMASYFIPSDSPIQALMHSGNTSVKAMAKALQDKGFAVKPILSPTVPKGQERLRICLHRFNTEQEIERLLKTIHSMI